VDKKKDVVHNINKAIQVTFNNNVGQDLQHCTRYVTGSMNGKLGRNKKKEIIFHRGLTGGDDILLSWYFRMSVHRWYMEKSGHNAHENANSEFVL